MDRRTVLKGGLVLAATSHTAIGIADAKNPLVILGEEFEAAYAMENSFLDAGKNIGNWTGWDAANEAVRKIVREIEKYPATTIEEIKIKARCVVWCHSGAIDFAHDDPATDTRLTQQIFEDILKI